MQTSDEHSASTVQEGGDSGEQIDISNSASTPPPERLAADFETYQQEK
jgi:hypothetical protein